MQFEYQIGDETLTLRIEKSGAGYVIVLGERVLTVEEAQWHDGELRLVINGERRVIHVAADGPRRWAALEGQTFVLTVPQAGTPPSPFKGQGGRRGRSADHRHEALEAQMPGVVRQVLVTVGERVERGQALLVLEAMKMEIRVAAPHAGVVERVAVSEGDPVQRGQLLVELVGS